MFMDIPFKNITTLNGIDLQRLLTKLLENLPCIRKSSICMEADMC